MTGTAFPINASSGSPSYTSQQFRQAISALVANGTTRAVGGRSGYGPGHQPTTLTVTSSTWTIGPFSCVIDPAFTTTQGPYLVSEDANNTGSVNAAPSSPNSRIDILYAQVNDTDIDSSGLRSVTVNYLAGTAANPGLTPSLPVRSFLLATISVPNSGSPTIAVNNTFSGGAGSLLPVSTAASLTGGTAIATPYEGMFAYALDTNQSYFYSGSAWTLFAEDTGWTTPSLSNSWVAFGGAFPAPEYRRLNGVTFLKGLMASGTLASTVFILPAGYRPLNSRLFLTASSTAASQILITSAGAVEVNAYLSGGSNADVSLELSYPAEQ